MRKQKLILIPVMILLFLIILNSVLSVATAPNSANTIQYLTNSDAQINGAVIEDLTSNNNDGTVYGGTTGISGIIDEAISINGATYNGSATKTKVSFDLPTDWDDNTWHHLAFSYKGSDGSLTAWLDAVSLSMTYSTQNSHLQNNMNQEVFLGLNNKVGGVTNPAVLSFDETMFQSEMFTQDNIDYLYNSGSPASSQQWDFSGGSPPVSNGSHVLETDIQILQNNPIQINSNTFQLIDSNSITPTNTSNASFSATLDVESSKDMNIECKFLINGSEYDTLSSRSFNSASSGNMYITSEKFTVIGDTSIGVDLYCRRSSVNGKLTVSNYVGIVHLLSDSLGREIPHKFMNNSFNLNNANYQLLANTSFLTGNTSASGLMRNLIFDGEITYNYDSASTIKLYSVVNGIESPVFTRYGTASSSGNGGNFNIAFNVTNQTNVPILIYGKSSSSDGSIGVKLSIKEFIGHKGEFNLTSLNDTSLTSTTWATLKKITLNNTDHASGDIIAKASVSTQSITGNQIVDYRIYYNGSAYSPEILRTINNAGAGVSILQYLFEDVGTGYFDVELQYKVQSNANVVGGSFMSYLAGDIKPFPNSFNLTAINKWNSSSLTNINVTLNSGTFFKNNSAGIVEIFSSNLFENLIVQSPNYINLFVNNHNVSNDLQVQMFKSVINVSFNESFTGNKISNWILYNGTDILINTTGWSSFFYPNPVFYNNLIVKSNIGGFSDRNIGNMTISLYDNISINYELLPTELSINVTSQLTGDRLSTYNVIARSLNRSHVLSASVTTENVTFGVINGDVYNVTITAANFANYGANVLKQIVGNSYLNFNLYTTNSVNITIKNEFDNTLITENVTLDFISDLYSYTYTTTTGKLYQDLLNPSSYTVRYSAIQNVNNSFPERFYFFSLGNKSYNEITLYLSNDTYSNITISVYNQDNQLLEGAEVRYLKYFAETNTYDLMGMGQTNINGVTVLPLQKNSEYYKFQVYYDNILRLTTTPSYIINDDITLQINLIDDVANNFFISNGMNGVLTFNNNTNNYKFDFSSKNGLTYNYCLKLYDVDSITGHILTNSSCLSSTSGTILINKQPINNTVVYAQGIVTISGINYVLDELYNNFSDDVSGKNIWLFFIMILTVIFSLMAIYSLRLTFILAPLPLLLGSLLGVVPVAFSICVGFELLGLILAVVVDNG